MKFSTAVLSSAALALLGMASSARAQSPPRPDDRLILSANGSTFSGAGAGGGGGGAATWLHPFSASTLLGIGAEYQTITDSRWAFGTLMGSVTLGSQSGSPTSLSGELHEGSGDISGRHFHYAIEALGVSHTLKNGLTLQLEDRQIDVDTSHGNLPKIGVAYAWTKKFQTTVSYAQSSGGNLRTEIGTARVDFFGQHVSFLAGYSYGQSVPVVVNLETGLEEPHAVLKLKQPFVGVSKFFSGVNVQLVGDYLELANIRRSTVTLVATVPLR